MNNTLLPLLLIATIPVGCSKMPAANSMASAASTTQPALVDIVAAYPAYQKMTAQPVMVNPELAMLCRGASPSEIMAASKTKGPHAHTAAVIFMNDDAAKTFGRDRQGPYPPGAVIVKQKDDLGYFDQPAGQFVRRVNPGVGGMVKRAPGFNPAHGDWEYFYFEDPKKVEAGRLPSCITCHDGARKTDYVFGTWSQPKNP